MRKLLPLMLTSCLAGCASAPVEQPEQIVREPAGVEILDVFDIENLSIYTAQGFVNNQTYRDLIPLTFLEKLIDLKIAKTCAGFLKNKVSYLDRVMVAPFEKLSPTDAKLGILVNDALLRLPPSPGNYFRGTRSCSFARDKSGAFKSAFVERAFMSTSEKKSSAEKFTYSKNEDFDETVQKGCMMTVEGKSGRRIFDLTGNYNDEREILFPLNSAFRLIGSDQAGDRVNATYHEMDPVMEKEAIEQLKRAEYQETLELYYPALAKSGDGGKISGKAAAEKKALSELSEVACTEAEKFFSTDPKFRAKIDKESPIYDLKNKKLNPADYSAPD